MEKKNNLLECWLMLEFEGTSTSDRTWQVGAVLKRSTADLWTAKGMPNTESIVHLRCQTWGQEGHPIFEFELGMGIFSQLFTNNPIPGRIRMGMGIIYLHELVDFYGIKLGKYTGLVPWMLWEYV